MSQVRYLRTDEREEAVRSLEWAATQSLLIEKDPYLWKWVLVSLHNAVQGFLVLALWNGNGLLTMKPKLAAKWLKALEDSAPFPGDRLDDFLSLYEKAKDSESFHLVGASPFAPGANHDRSMKRLNEFRNEFIHFTPKGWSLELAGLPAICLDVLAIVRHFGWETTPINWYEASYVTRAKGAHDELRKELLALEVAYAG